MGMAILIFLTALAVVLLPGLAVAWSRASPAVDTEADKFRLGHYTPTWAQARGFVSNDTGDEWSAKIEPKVGVKARVKVRLSRPSNGRDSPVVEVTARVKLTDAHVPMVMKSTQRASSAREGHPTLSRWYEVDGEDAEVLGHMGVGVVSALSALLDGAPAWTDVRVKPGVITCTYKLAKFTDRGTEADLEALLEGLLEGVEACARAWPELMRLEHALDARLRDESEPESIRWRAMRLLLTEHAGSQATRDALDDRASWPDDVVAASVIWAGASRDMSEDEEYLTYRDAATSEDDELAAAAARALAERAAWRALTDGRMGVVARAVCARRALADPARPDEANKVDDALVGVLTGILPEESARVELYEALMGSGWAPSDEAGVKLVERGTDALTAAMVAWLEAHGATSDARATFDALRAEGFAGRVDAALERASGKGMLSVSGDASSGGLSPLDGEAGALTAPD